MLALSLAEVSCPLLCPLPDPPATPCPHSEHCLAVAQPFSLPSTPHLEPHKPRSLRSCWLLLVPTVEGSAPSAPRLNFRGQPLPLSSFFPPPAPLPASPADLS